MHYLKPTASGIAIVVGGIFIAFANGGNAPAMPTTMAANAPTTAPAVDPQVQIWMHQVQRRMDLLEAKNFRLEVEVQSMKRELDAERMLVSQTLAEPTPATAIPLDAVKHKFNGGEYYTLPLTAK